MVILMKANELLDVIGDTDDNMIVEAKELRKRKKNAWAKWGAMAACLCIVIIGAMVWSKVKTPPDNSGSTTLLGADKIYPTVMVQGQLYEWRKGAAICNELPDECVYYGDLVHVEEETPNNDGEFASVFSVSGQIYTTPQSDTVVYLCLTTDWLDNTVVVFDIVEP